MVHIATSAEIGGSLDSDEVKVLHRSGAYRGSILVNKKDDGTLAAGIASGEIVPQETFVPGKVFENARFEEPSGDSISNPPNSYPHSAVIVVNGVPTGGTPPTTAVVDGVPGVPVFAFDAQTFTVPFTFPAPGPYSVLVVFNNGDRGTAEEVMLPVVEALTQPVTEEP